MAMTGCGECGQLMSSQAVACPQCGAPVRKARRPLKAIGLALCVVGVVAGAGLGFGAGWPTLLVLVGAAVFIAGRLRD